MLGNDMIVCHMYQRCDANLVHVLFEACVHTIALGYGALEFIKLLRVHGELEGEDAIQEVRKDRR